MINRLSDSIANLIASSCNGLNDFPENFESVFFACSGVM